ncbi:cellulase family glycosylhydrolase [Planctomycetales bacterium ZRK34]|nr:cellulase family glycosylhydrolase [Planctomycetales bacterium ZRK34]
MLKFIDVFRPMAWSALLIVLSLSACSRPEQKKATTAEPEKPEAAAPDPATSIGVNLAGAEFGPTDGKYGQAYIYPGAKSFDYFKSQNMRVIRLPFKWERLQPALMGPFDEAELSRMDQVVELARQRDMLLLMDLHNYARYRGKLIGTDEVPNAAFADFWRRFAEHYKDEPAVWAYGIMNEPHGTKGLWPAAAQAAVDAIRRVDMHHVITVCGDAWSGAHSWRKYNDDLNIHDPADNFLYEAHQYFDHNNSGTYQKPYDADGAGPDTGVKRLQPFITWLKERNARGFIGEFGVPAYDPRWLVVLDNFLAEMKANNLGGTYWAAGPWWGYSPLSVEPVDGIERPQMQVLAWYAGHRTRPAEAAVDMSYIPPKSTPGMIQFSHDKPYTYKNDASEIKLSQVPANQHLVRCVNFKHRGNPAWVGFGVYYGKLDCKDFDAFELTVRADAPCKIGLSAYLVKDTRYNADVEVGTDWQTLVIPFSQFKNKDGKPLDPAAAPVEKVSFQPNITDASRAKQGNNLYLDIFRPIRQ